MFAVNFLSHSRRRGDTEGYNPGLHSLREGELLFLAAVAGGLINSVAGGGGFICFPALLFTGVPPINANATNTIALWPGTAASVVAYRGELRRQTPRLLLPLVGSSIGGGILGALLLLLTPQKMFLRMVPWLMLVATVLFIFGGRIMERIRGRIASPSGLTQASSGQPATWIPLAQLVVAVYIGYFGAGAGIVILALLAVMGMQNIHAMNGIKTLLATSANGVALITFIAARAIYWPEALVMLGGAILGGYGGAWYAQRLRPAVVRGFVIATGCVMTTYFFWRTSG
ncbi:MAG: sulfite exporter TauE/SafE family protein [Acidobacteria bacterium]|nr:sulfite exporter TauE/SafE family protein [Acidobacteriota bacterium]